MQTALKCQIKMLSLPDGDVNHVSMLLLIDVVCVLQILG